MVFRGFEKNRKIKWTFAEVSAGLMRKRPTPKNFGNYFKNPKADPGQDQAGCMIGAKKITFFRLYNLIQIFIVIFYCTVLKTSRVFFLEKSSNYNTFFYFLKNL